MDNATMNGLYCFVDHQSGDRWFKLPADFEPDSSTVYRPMYLPGGPCYERQPVTVLRQRMTDVARKQWQWRAYDRKKLTPEEIWRTPRRLLMVSGPPGDGKSTAAYAWMYKTCLMTNCKALWIDCAESVNLESLMPIGWYLSPRDGKVNVTEHTWGPSRTLEHLEDARIVVYDGIRQTSHEKWKRQFVDLCSRGVAVILVSSDGLDIHQGNIGHTFQIRHRVPSWTLDEYIAACKYDAFWKSVSEEIEAPGTASGEGRNMAIEEKYLVAGHSARFMFTHTSRDVELILRHAAAKILTIDTLRQALRSWGNSQPINTLLAWLWENGPTLEAEASFLTEADLCTPPSDLAVLRDKSEDFPGSDNLTTPTVFVSRFALERVLACLTTDVDKMRGYGVMLDQPAVVGYAFEVRFLQLLRNHANGTDGGIVVAITDKKMQEETWPVGHVVEMHNDISNAIVGMSIKQRVNGWVWVGRNAAGFDAVHMLASDNDEQRIRFVQVTAAERRSFKLFAVEIALQQLAEKGICFTHVDPLGRITRGDWMTFGGHPWSKTKHPKDLVVMCTVSWNAK